MVVKISIGSTLCLSVTIVGNRDLALATGKIFLGPMEIKIPEHFQKTIPELNIAEVVEADDNVIYLSKEDPYRFKLDIEVEAADRVYVRGRGVDTLLTGQLKVTGFVNDPKVYGTLKSVHGRYQEFGKVLNIKEGVLTFDGSIPPSPYLNIVGVAIEGGYEIRLILAGSIQKPEITIESTPDVGQEEALSMLLFGSKPESNSMFQNIQLADGLRRLSGHGGGLDPLGLGRKILRVDDINFKSDPDNPESTSVGIGKHLTDKVYFEVERGQQDGNTKTRIEIQITPKISIENVSEQKGNTSFGVKWRFDY